MFEALERRLEGVMKKLRGESRLTEENVTEALRDIRRALLEADVELDVAREFIASIKEKALGAEVTLTVTAGQHMVKLLHDALVTALGGEPKEPHYTGNPAQILLCGLQGSGKTTTAAKLALHLRDKKGRRPMLAACDIYRPAAIEQLKVLGEKMGIPVHFEEPKDPVGIARRARQKARDLNCDIVIYDTAGRLQIDEALMEELSQLKKELSPEQIYFVADAMTGQEAVRVAKSFHDRLGVTGVILTKTDGDARGGAALSLARATGTRVTYAGTGEAVTAFELFDPDRMAGRILGMGDIVGLVERAQDTLDKEEVERLSKKMMKNTFDLDDMLAQIRQVKKMGSLTDILGMMPGGAAMKDAASKVDPKQILHVEAILSSMTKKERKAPKILNGQRRARIAKGSGTSLQEVNQVLKQYEQMRTLMSQISKMGGRMGALRKMAGGKLPSNLKLPGMGGF